MPNNSQPRQSPPQHGGAQDIHGSGYDPELEKIAGILLNRTTKFLFQDTWPIVPLQLYFTSLTLHQHAATPTRSRKSRSKSTIASHAPADREPSAGAAAATGTATAERAASAPNPTATSDVEVALQAQLEEMVRNVGAGGGSQTPHHGKIPHQPRRRSSSGGHSVVSGEPADVRGSQLRAERRAQDRAANDEVNRDGGSLSGQGVGEGQAWQSGQMAGSREPGQAARTRSPVSRKQRTESLGGQRTDSRKETRGGWSRGSSGYLNLHVTPAGAGAHGLPGEPAHALEGAWGGDAAMPDGATNVSLARGEGKQGTLLREDVLMNSSLHGSADVSMGTMGTIQRSVSPETSGTGVEDTPSSQATPTGAHVGGGRSRGSSGDGLGAQLQQSPRVNRDQRGARGQEVAAEVPHTGREADYGRVGGLSSTSTQAWGDVSTGATQSSNGATNAAPAVRVRAVQQPVVEVLGVWDQPVSQGSSGSSSSEYEKLVMRQWQCVPIGELQMEQVQAEKKALKRHLRAIDNAYVVQYGKPPSRADKEVSRGKYMRYYKLKRHLQQIGAEPASP